MSDNETTPKFMWKTFEVKNHGPTTNKKFQYEEQSRCTWIYLTQDLQSFTDYLTSTFSPHHYIFIFRNMLGVFPKFDLSLLLEASSRRKWVFTQTQNEWEMNVQRTQPIFLFRKSIRKLAWRLVEDFLEK